MGDIIPHMCNQISLDNGNHNDRIFLNLNFPKYLDSHLREFSFDFGSMLNYMNRSGIYGVLLKNAANDDDNVEYTPLVTGIEMNGCAVGGFTKTETIIHEEKQEFYNNNNFIPGLSVSTGSIPVNIGRIEREIKDDKNSNVRDTSKWAAGINRDIQKGLMSLVKENLSSKNPLIGKFPLVLFSAEPILILESAIAQVNNWPNNMHDPRIVFVLYNTVIAFLHSYIHNKSKERGKINNVALGFNDPDFTDYRFSLNAGGTQFDRIFILSQLIKKSTFVTSTTK